MLAVKNEVHFFIMALLVGNPTTAQLAVKLYFREVNEKPDVDRTLMYEDNGKNSHNV